MSDDFFTQGDSIPRDDQQNGVTRTLLEWVRFILVRLALLRDVAKGLLPDTLLSGVVDADDGIVVGSTGLKKSVLTVTVPLSGWIANATDEIGTIDLCTLPPKSRILAVYSDTTEEFTGGAASDADLKVGTVDDTAGLILEHDVFSAPVVKGLISADWGLLLQGAGVPRAPHTPSWTDPVAVTAVLTVTDDDVENLETGSVTFHILFEVLP